MKLFVYHVNKVMHVKICRYLTINTFAQKHKNKYLRYLCNLQLEYKSPASNNTLKEVKQINIYELNIRGRKMTKLLK